MHRQPNNDDTQPIKSPHYFSAVALVLLYNTACTATTIWSAWSVWSGLSGLVCPVSVTSIQTETVLKLCECQLLAVLVYAFTRFSHQLFIIICNMVIIRRLYLVVTENMFNIWLEWTDYGDRDKRASPHGNPPWILESITCAGVFFSSALRVIILLIVSIVSALLSPLLSLHTTHQQKWPLVKLFPNHVHY